MKKDQAGREFLVEVATLRRQPGSRRKLQISGEIEDLCVSDARVPEGALVELDVVLESVQGGILVSGHVRAPWVGTCRRCLEEARGELDVEVRELCELDPVDEELTYRLSRDELDLRPIAHDACILELPLAPLCRDDCLGLCPICGANRNVQACSCAPALDRRFAALSVLSEAEDEASALGRDNN